MVDMTDYRTREHNANIRADELLNGTGQTLATMTPDMYAQIKRQLSREGLWHGGK